jgi:hypothetical protein
MGLSLVELLAGLGRSLEFKLSDDRDARVFSFGWLVPLLAVFVILDLLSFWIFAWAIREVIAVTAISILAVVTFAGSYNLAARLVFPSEPEHFRDLDSHFFKVRRIVFSMLVLMVAIQWAFVLSQPKLRVLATQPVSVGLTLALLALMVTAMFLKHRGWLRAVMALLVGRYLLIYLL